ncbi:MAG: type VI secretion system baseplate subunit TssF [Planctomycetia bacterium]
MRESLDVWFRRELEFFRRNSGDFARRFPRIAARLSLGAAGVADPHVERLIQAFAYLNARTMLRLDDSFPELVDAMLGVISPQQLLPIPSMAIVELQLDRAQKELFGGCVIDRGTLLDSERVGTGTCRFRTCAPVQLYPLEVRGVELSGRPFPPLAASGMKDAQALLKISLSGFDPRLSLSAMNVDCLQFFVAEPNYERAARLMQLICSDTLQIVAQPGGTTDCRVLSEARIHPLGMDCEHGVLPRNSRIFHGYQLVTEYFVMPARFLFFEIRGLKAAFETCPGGVLDLFLLLGRSDNELQGTIRSESIRTGCTPIVNLFSRTADGIPLNYREAEYRVIPDAREEDHLEIYSVDAVALDDQLGEQRQLQPFFARSLVAAADHAGYWHSIRRPGPVEGDPGLLNSSTEVYLSLVDPHFSCSKAASGMLLPTVTCFNRSLPEQLSHRQRTVPVNFSLTNGGGPVGTIRCHVAPTPVYRNSLGRDNLWALVSQLSLNHLSLASEPDGLASLQEILSLNDPADSVQTRNLIAGVEAISAAPCVRRMQQSFVRGIEISLLLQDEKFSGDSAWMFARILNAFFSLYASINSFTVLRANTVGRSRQGLDAWRWPLEDGCRRTV